jgi:predicted dinucleotide-binding enzyme
MKARIAIIGEGNVGNALRQGLERAHHEIRSVGKDPDRVREYAAWASIIVLAVPFGAIDDALAEMGDAVDGKIIVDVTNALGPDHQLAVGFTTSGAEELQKKAPRSRVVKAFNTVFAQNMATGEVAGTKLSLFVAGDDDPARRVILALGRDIGFDPIDAGPLANARWLETLGFLNIQLGYVQKMGPGIGFKLVH